MIEKVVILIINELGPVGILVAGLYFILGRHLEKISKHIEIINHEIGTVNETVKACTDRMCDKLDKLGDH